MPDTAQKRKEKLVEVNSEDLKLGMYVSALDRPWLESTFLFQGFLISDPDDIEEVKSQTEYVFVDALQTDASVDLQSAVLKRQKSNPDSGPGVETVFEQPNRARPKKPQPKKAPLEKKTTAYTSVAELRRELGQAKEDHQEASVLIQEVMETLRAGGKLNVKTAQKAIEPIVESVMRNESAMSWLVRIRQDSEYLYRHSVSSAVWATGMASHMGMPKEDVTSIGLGAMLLDVGKTKLPRRLLVKPESLSADEMVIAREHVEHGLKILGEAKGIDEKVKLMVRTHHERHDGAGYPAGMSGLDIPVVGRIAGIVDYYDAVTSDRPYATAQSSYDCLREMNRRADIDFQKEMLEQFIQSIGFFPPGTLVQLSDGSVAVVVAQNRRHRLMPEVMIVKDPDHNDCSDFRLVDLQMDVASEFTNETLFIDKGLEPGSFGIDPAEFFLE